MESQNKGFIFDDDSLSSEPAKGPKTPAPIMEPIGTSGAHELDSLRALMARNDADKLTAEENGMLDTYTAIFWALYGVGIGGAIVGLVLWLCPSLNCISWGF